MNLVLYGPPGVGKSTIGPQLAARLGREFVDGDVCLEQRWGRPVPDYFAAGEEALFRAREAELYRALARRDDLVLAPGGGALLNPHTRAVLEGTGVIICLGAELDTLLARLAADARERPLLAGDTAGRLAALLQQRQALYRSFAHQVPTDGRSLEHVVKMVLERFQAAASSARLELGSCSALIGPGLLARLPDLLAEKALRPPYIVISDSNVAPLYGAPVAQALNAALLQVPAGEAHKTLDTVRSLYGACLEHGLERAGTLLALGGGVIGDTAGFVAATFMRGVAWANLPTTVLAMADASLGGKVGVDLPEGKNLVGAFHPPRLVVADTDTLATLPAVEQRCGLAEVIKAGLIADVDMVERLMAGTLPLSEAIARAAAVKAGIVNSDPLEQGERALLNLGHTIGHGVEAASGYALRHGEAIAIGMVAEAQLAEGCRLAQPGLAEAITRTVRHFELPVRAAGLDPAAVRLAMQSDKKKAGGRLKFALPRALGDVTWGVEVDEPLLRQTLEDICHDGER